MKHLSANAKGVIACIAPVAISLSACTGPVSDVGGGQTAVKERPIVIINEQSFANCPAYSPTESLTVFDVTNWAGHTRGAVLRPNKLAQWNPDFSSSTVLRFTLGQKPTLGYGVQSAPGIKSVRGELRIPVEIVEPAKGAIVGQAITDPCMYLQVTGTGYSAVSVFDARTSQVLKKLAR